MFRLIKFLDKKDKNFLIFIYFLTLVWVAINSSQWLLIAKLTDQFYYVYENKDNITFNDSIVYSLKLFFFILGLNIIGFSLKFLTRSLTVNSSLKLSLKIKNILYLSSLIMKETEINKLSVSSISNRMTNDVFELQTSLINMLTFAIERTLMLIFCIVYSIILSPILSTIYIIIFIFVGTFGAYCNKKSYSYYHKANKSLDGTNRIMKENIIGNKIIRIFSIQEHHSKRFEKYNNKWFKSILRGENIVYVAFVFILFGINSLTIFLLIIGGSINYNVYFQNIGFETISIGIIVAFINYLWETIFAISGMLEVYISIIRVKPIIARLNEIINSDKEKIDEADNNNLKKHNIEFKNVSFKYSDSKENILININTKFKERKIYGLIGPTGCGKSTLINLICNLYDNYDGQILIGGIDYNNLGKNTIRNNISISFQEKLLYKGTFKSNILIGNKDASDKEILKSLKQSEAYDFVMNSDNNIDGLVSEKGSNLSGGQKQRISLARAFIKKAKILILDDSLSAVDNITREKIIKTIKKDFSDKTIIISGQQIKTISFADEILVMDNGEIISKGTHKTLLKKCELYKKIYESQKSIGE